MAKPSARQILKEQVKKRATRFELIHDEFGEVGFRSILKENGNLMKELNAGRLDKDKVKKLVVRIESSKISDLFHRDTLRSTLLFWSGYVDDIKVQLPSVDNEAFRSLWRR